MSDPILLRHRIAYWRWRFRCWTVLPGDRFEDFMRMIAYTVTEVRNGYVRAEMLTREAECCGLPARTVRVARPLPAEWWPL